MTTFMLPEMSKCIMSWCGGEREGRDRGGLWREVGGDLMEPSPAPNMERPGLAALVSTSEKKSGE